MCVKGERRGERERGGDARMKHIYKWNFPECWMGEVRGAVGVSVCACVCVCVVTFLKERHFNIIPKLRLQWTPVQ